MSKSESNKKMEKVIRFLKKKGREGATYRELDLHLGGPICHKKWIQRHCGAHPDIRAEGSTNQRRLYYQKGHGHEGFDNKFYNKSVSFVLPRELLEALKEATWDLRMTQSEIVTKAVTEYLKKIDETDYSSEE